MLKIKKFLIILIIILVVPNGTHACDGDVVNENAYHNITINSVL